MKNSGNRMSILALGCCAISLLSCQKESLSPEATVEADILYDKASLTLPVSGYQTNIISPLALNNSDCYTDGIIEYSESNQVLAIVDFGNGFKNEATIIKNGKSSKLSLQQNKSDFKKVIINPLVKTEDCNYIVQGTIKYYSKNGEWVATVDYGDGTCDEWATKKWKDGSKTFSLNKKKLKK